MGNTAPRYHISANVGARTSGVECPLHHHAYMIRLRLPDRFDRFPQLSELAADSIWYNFCRIHKSLRVTPAMAAGVSETLRDMEWIAALVEAAAPKRGKRGPYKKGA
jgi:hypothetical protein